MTPISWLPMLEVLLVLIVVAIYIREFTFLTFFLLEWIQYMGTDTVYMHLLLRIPKKGVWLAGEVAGNHTMWFWICFSSSLGCGGILVPEVVTFQLVFLLP